jgi:UDP-N-acetylmuramoylalanine--D-glutamate ligase
VTWTANRNALVIGLGASGLAAARLLRERGASRVVAIDQASNSSLQAVSQPLPDLGIEVILDAQELPPGEFAVAVISPGVSIRGHLAAQAIERKIPLISELELGFQAYRSCPIVAITGTNGKTTTTELTERALNKAGKRSVAAGNIGLPLCELARTQPDLDVLTLEVSSFQLEAIDQFRPQIAVVLNVTPDHFDRHAGMEDYIRAKARIFANQTQADWAVIQTDAWRSLRQLKVQVNAQVLTFSAEDQQADFILSNGHICRQHQGEPRRLMALSQTRLRGPHNAENMMAVLAIAEAMQLPQSEVHKALVEYQPAPHRCEIIAEAHGVLFVNDSKATNVDAVAKALVTMPLGPDGERNVWLIAGGKDKGFNYDVLGPCLARRVKGAFLLGETRDRIQKAWGSFTPCRPVESLIEAVNEAARRAIPGDVILFSPACSSFDMFRNYQHRGEVFRQAVMGWVQSRQSASSPNPVTCDNSVGMSYNENQLNNFEPEGIDKSGLSQLNAAKLTGVN